LGRLRRWEGDDWEFLATRGNDRLPEGDLRLPRIATVLAIDPGIESVLDLGVG
jgi:hypothetical protein